MSAARLGGLVERRGDVAAHAVADRALARVAARHLREHALHVLDRGAAERSQSAVTRRGDTERDSSRPEVSFGKKYVDFCGIVSPRARELGHLRDRRRAHEERRVGLALVDRGHRLVGVRRVGHALRLEALDRLRVERVVVRVDPEEARRSR